MAGFNSNNELHLTERESQMSSGTNKRRNRASNGARYSPYVRNSTGPKFVFCKNLLIC